VTAAEIGTAVQRGSGAQGRAFRWLAFAAVGALTWPMAAFACDQQGSEAIVRKVQEEWPVRASGDPIVLYLNALGSRLARASPDPGHASPTWHFHVIRDRSAYAFAVGDGHVFVTDGAVLFAEDESELAAVLAHEMGHELAGHLCALPPPTLWGQLVDMFRGGGQEQDEAQHVAIGSLTQVIEPSREREADRVALGLLSNAGFDPHAMLRVAQRLARAGGGRHLADPQRTDALQRLLARVPRVAVGSTRAFLQARAALREPSAGPARSGLDAAPPEIEAHGVQR
jgi:predicted Zn-dependent protease